jgi:hypothetical protein
MPTLLLVDLQIAVSVNSKDDQVGQDVDSAAGVQDHWILERHLLCRLHHEQDDGDVRAGCQGQYPRERRPQKRVDLHLRIHGC